MNNIFILTGKIQSGKTTSLFQFWEKNKMDCVGFLTPDVDGERFFLFLENEKMIEMESNYLLDEKKIIVGKFSFSQKAFDEAKMKLRILIHSDKNYIIIDEIGKLEIENNGLEPELSLFIQNFIQTQHHSQLILVVRDYLLESVQKKYNLGSATILSIEELARW